MRQISSSWVRKQVLETQAERQCFPPEMSKTWPFCRASDVVYLNLCKEFDTVSHNISKNWRDMDDPGLEVFGVRLDGALRNLVWEKVSLLIAGKLELDGL